MSKILVFVTSVVKPLTLTFVFVITRVITGRPTNFIEAALHHAFREILMQLLQDIDFFDIKQPRTT